MACEQDGTTINVYIVDLFPLFTTEAKSANPVPSHWVESATEAVIFGFRASLADTVWNIFKSWRRSF